jgi:4-diphosphocytidyl-2-C-methyl-D-erythritol kinase
MSRFAVFHGTEGEFKVYYGERSRSLKTMKKLSAKSFTRITLALDIIGQIQQGPYKDFHELGTVKHLISLHDIVTVEESADMRVVCDNPSVPLDNTNSCWKACELLKQKYGIDANVSITIQKNIPVKGGLAGGSANAATTLALLCDLWKINIDTSAMIALSRGAGQDVPFYFCGPTAFDSEAGQVLAPISNQLRFDMILVLPDFGVPTAEAYRTIDYSRIAKLTGRTLAMRDALASGDRAGVIHNIHNDFELTVFERFPKLEQVKYKLIESGCETATLSGSGSSVVGILESHNDFDRIKNKIGYPCMLVSSAHGRRYTSLSRRGNTMAGRPFRERTGSFRWNSKQELCDYFNRQYGLTKKIIEAEIKESAETFRLRQGEAVATRELWQKVGISLEKKLTALKIDRR